MKQHAMLLAVLTGCSLSLSAQTRATTDSLSSQAFDEAVVTGTRTRSDIRHLSQTVTVVSRAKIEQAMQPSLLPVLTEQVPGLFVTARGVMGYGVSGGAAGGMSLRGLSGGTARLMVLIDGHPQYAGIFGHPIADAYQSYWADRVEVLRGPASVLYGSNAMGGVINIVTRQSREDGVRTNLRAGYGSYNSLETEVSNAIRKGRFTSLVSGSYNRSDGHRDDMGFEQYGGYGKLGYEVSDHWNLRADVNVTHFNASYPGPVTARLLDGDQRITRGVTSAAVENKFEKTSGALSFFYNWGHHWINDGYTPSAGEGPQDDRFRSDDRMMGISLYQSARLFKGNRLTAGFDWFRYGGQAWSEMVSGEREGTRNQLVDKQEDEWAGYIDLRQDFGRFVTFNGGLRLDHHSRVGSEWVPQVGLTFHLPHDAELKASASKGFRYPILREMYMFPPQNPDLKPESSRNYELAYSQRLLGGRLAYGVNLFYINGKNLIQTLPNPSGSGMLNQNTGRIENAGVEVQAAYRISRSWSVDANYSYLHMEHPVIAAPEHKLYAGAAFTQGCWSVSTGLQLVNGLYTSVKANGRGSEQTEQFLLWNLRGQYRVNRWLQLWARGENLLAQRYEINAGYPMPKATFMAGVKIDF